MCPLTIQCSTPTSLFLRLALKLFRGEPAISGFDWNFTATHRSSDSFLTLNGSSLHEILLSFHSAHGQVTRFRVYDMQLSALFRLGFPTASLLSSLTLLHIVTRWPVLQKVRGRTYKVLPLLVNIEFQVLFHSPPGVLFNFPSRYYFTIGYQGVFSLIRWSGLLHTGFLVSRTTLDSTRSSSHFAYEAFTLSCLLFQNNSATTFSNLLQSSTPKVFLLLVWASPISLATTFGIDFSFFSWSYLDVSVHSVSLHIYYFIHIWILIF